MNTRTVKITAVTARATVSSDVEASELGWAPGYWPTYAEFNGRQHERLGALTHRGEFAGVQYRAVSNGATVNVWND